MFRSLLFLLLLSISMSSQAGERFALLAGVDKYPKNSLLNSLRFPARDVESLASVLLTSGYQPDNVAVLTRDRGHDDPRYLPTAANINRELNLLLKRIKADDSLLIALAGHGVLMKVKRTVNGQEVEREESLFCPLDASLSGKDLSTLISVNQLYERLDRLPAALKLVLSDACRDKPFAGAKPGGVINLKPVDPPQTVAAVFSCAQDEVAMEDETLDGGHGVFFHYVIQGLQGQADVNRDGKVTLLELSTHVTEEVPKFVAKKYGISQTPEILATKLLRIPLLETSGVVTNTIGMRLALIPAGEFLMGSPDSDSDASGDEKPQHRVRISQPYYLGVHEVTVGQFKQFVNAQGYKTEAEANGAGGYGFVAAKAAKGEFPWEQRPEFTWRSPGFVQADSHPVVNVSWNDAQAFCTWLTRQDGKRYRLPTEAEWEYACRAGSTTVYSSGDDPATLARVANLADASLKAKASYFSSAVARDDGYPFTAPVGSFQANRFGLFDMHGNVWEWCLDRYDSDYYKELAGKTSVDPQGSSKASNRVYRGGSWNSTPRNCRSAYRGSYSPDDRSSNLGFRVAAVQSGR